MIVCDKCGKENQDHYKFCLGCGAELKRSDAPKPFRGTPPHGVEPVATPAGGASRGLPDFAVAAAPARSEPSAAVPAPVPTVAPVAAGASMAACPQCGHMNPSTNRFCLACGYSLAAGLIQSRPVQAAPPVAVGRAVRLTALNADGSEAGAFDLPRGDEVVVGRDTGSIFAGDSYLSPSHAIFRRRGDSITVADAGSLNGVYIKVYPHAPIALEFGDVFRIGQEIIRFEELVGVPDQNGVRRFGSPAAGYIGRLSLVIGRDTTGNSFPIPERGVHCGRERGDILFSEDGYVSGLHCRIAPEADGRVHLTDLGSSNGTFYRIRRELGVNPQDVLLMGQQLFRLDF